MRWRGIVRSIAHIVILTLVVWGIVTAIQSSAHQLDHQRALLDRRAEELEIQANNESTSQNVQLLREQAEELRRQVRDYWKVDWRFLIASCAVYALSLLPAAIYWNQCMSAMGQRVPWQTAFWAYFYGNLGKYLPGKAMVIVLRLSSLTPLGVRRVATAVTIFMETLTMMAVGAALAAGCLAVLNLDVRFTILAVVLAIGMIGASCPPLLRYVIARLQPGVASDEMRQWTQRLNWNLMLRGWVTLGLTWIGFGLSLGCLLQGMASTEMLADSAIQFWLSTFGACSLAVVLGFISLIPSGAGVREVVLTMVLAPVVGPTAALASAIWLRITWLIVELTMAAALYFVRFPNSSVQR